MLIQKLNDCEEMIAGDGTVLRKLLHPVVSSAELGEQWL
jgi:hypothetical protein